MDINSSYNYNLINLNRIPNQNFNVVLNGQDCNITLQMGNDKHTYLWLEKATLKIFYLKPDEMNRLSFLNYKNLNLSGLFVEILLSILL